jgi:hypothetical protein
MIYFTLIQIFSMFKKVIFSRAKTTPLNVLKINAKSMVRHDTKHHNIYYNNQLQLRV